ncbi:MAG: nucleoside recognition domain-containing protein [Clostridia bacterium]|nr:nucleoside recognition domain-containing protein [Clostridia bacterium]
MLNYVWGFMMIAAVIVSIFTGNLADVGTAAINGAAEGVQLMITMTGLVCLWTGLMEIAEKSGMILGISFLLRPITRILFPKLPPKSEALDAIVMNMSANILGISNAATPFGLRAMQALDKRNNGRARASNDMCMFVVINTASIQLLPTTVILFRTNSGSAAPSEILLPIWVVSAVTFIVSVILTKLMEKRS